jgi:hypothetical protein
VDKFSLATARIVNKTACINTRSLPLPISLSQVYTECNNAVFSVLNSVKFSDSLSDAAPAPILIFETEVFSKLTKYDLI